MNEKPQSAKTSLGMGQNLEGALCYLLGWITGLIFLIAEKDNKFVRFHAVQSIILAVALTVLSILIGLIFPSVIVVIFDLGLFALWIFMMYSAYIGKRFKLPIAGDMAEKQAATLN